MKTKRNITHIDFKEDIIDTGFEISTLSKFYDQIDENRHIPHIINFNAILFVTTGEGKHEIDFQTYNYGKNNVIFVNKGQEHRWIDYQNTEGYILLFTQNFYQENQIIFNDINYSYPFNSYIYEPIVSIKEEQTKSFYSLVEYISEEYRIATKSEILQYLLRIFLDKIKTNNHNTEAKSSQKELFIRFLNIIDHNISKSRNINDYCQWLSIPYKKLNEVCKIFTNKTAKDLLNEIILLKAKQLLIENKKNISEIAYFLSFNDPTNFTKFFKKHTNTTPKSFRENI